MFAIFTDNKPLTFAIHCIPEPWLARQPPQLYYLAEFTSYFRHVTGVDNIGADALSTIKTWWPYGRRFCQKWPKTGQKKY
jgi:hypothetical protein